MARKNSSKSEKSGSFLFDSRTEAVMSGPDSKDIKEKVQSVREVVPGKSNNDIVLVLQYYDYSVERTIQAFLEDGAKEALGEWHRPAAKMNKRKRNRRKAAKNLQSSTGPPSVEEGTVLTSSETSLSGLSTTHNTSVNGYSSSSQVSSLTNGDVYSGEIRGFEITNSSFCAKAAPGRPLSNGTISSSLDSKLRKHPAASGSHTLSNHVQHQDQRTHPASERNAESDVGAGGDNHRINVLKGLDRVEKDLQRQTTSLDRLNRVFCCEIRRSYDSVRAKFEEMRTLLNAREKEMVLELNFVELQACDIFSTRHEQAALLRKRTEREMISQLELSDLRTDVKHFVSERMIDEELGKTSRFLCDSDSLKEQILSFGEVVPVNCAYSTQRPHVSPVPNSVLGNDDLDSSSSLCHSPEPPSSSSPEAGQGEGSGQIPTDEIAALLQDSLKIQGYESSGVPLVNGDSSAGNSEEDDKRASSTHHRGQNYARKDQQENKEVSHISSTPVSKSFSSSSVVAPAEPHVSSRNGGESCVDHRVKTSSSSQASVESPSPYTHRTQWSPSRGRGYRGRGRGHQGPRGYGGGQNEGWGNPRRPYSSGSNGRRGARRDQYRRGGHDHVVNGNSF